MNDIPATTPQPVLGLYDRPMWDSIRAGKMELQRCNACGTYQYPPGPGCPSCLSMDLTWVPVSGRGRILSWVIFHRQYLPAYKAPYNAIAVQLEEGPIMISNLEGDPPDGSWIGHSVQLTYSTMPDGVVLPRFALSEEPAA